MNNTNINETNNLYYLIKDHFKIDEEKNNIPYYTLSLLSFLGKISDNLSEFVANRSEESKLNLLYCYTISLNLILNSFQLYNDQIFLKKIEKLFNENQSTFEKKNEEEINVETYILLIRYQQNLSTMISELTMYFLSGNNLDLKHKIHLEGIFYNFLIDLSELLNLLGHTIETAITEVVYMQEKRTLH